MPFPLLDRINSPADLKSLSPDELVLLAGDVRRHIIDTITAVGGHFAANLGTVELTVALHKVFDTPKDKIVWDVGHQSYPHKILTGRKDQLHTIRKTGGLSGFCKITESEHDAFGAGHASTSISAALGMAVARDLKGEDYKAIAVIGDGALTGGLAYEALNNAGSEGRDLIVVLNDNQMSISPNVGAISKYLTQFTSHPYYRKQKKAVYSLIEKLPLVGESAGALAHHVDAHLKTLLVPGGLFEVMGFRYYGPIDGHNLPLLLSTFENLKTIKGPVLLHILTVKGKGYEAAEADSVKFHGLSPKPSPSKKKAPAKNPRESGWSKVFGKSLVALAKKDKKIVAITAAMSTGTGLDEFEPEFPERFFDVGIAEAHAVCFAAGLARDGMKPVVAIYSTFLQRAYDQIIHDVALQKLPVIFVLDRAGLVGADGPTHHGSFDMSYLSIIPNMVVGVPKDGDELFDMLFTATQHKEGPFALRFPRGNTLAPNYERGPKLIPVGSWETLREGEGLAFIASGSMVDTALTVASQLEEDGFFPAVVNARFVKPLDDKMLTELSKNFGALVTLEENALRGGLGSAVVHRLSEKRLSLPVLTLGLPDRFVGHASSVEDLYEKLGLMPGQIAQSVSDFCAESGVKPAAKADRKTG